ncbi:MAG: hypothetical protein U1A78_29540 [Polyangia bacterium]
MTRRDMSLLTGALIFGAVLGVVASPRPLLAADVRGNGKNLGKVGDRCESSSDCEQSPVALRCMPLGDHKQCVVPPRMIPPPT